MFSFPILGADQTVIRFLSPKQTGLNMLQDGKYKNSYLGHINKFNNTQKSSCQGRLLLYDSHVRSSKIEHFSYLSLVICFSERNAFQIIKGQLTWLPKPELK